MKFKAPFPFWVLSAFLLLVFLTGGSSRGDVLSLALLLPATVIICGIGCYTLQRNQVHGNFPLFLALSAAFFVVGLHLVPLPPEIWHGLGGRSDIVAIDKIAGLDGNWRALTVTPANGWDSFLRLFVPFTILVLGVQLDRKNIYRLLWIVLALTLVSGGFGIMQAVGSNDSPAYLYRISDRENAVGLFANRNHAAVLLACVFPMLAAIASVDVADSRARKQLQIFGGSVALILIPLILITGSRSGLVVSAIGLLGAAFLYKNPVQSRDSGSRSFRIVVRSGRLWAGIAIFCVASATYVFARAKAVERIFGDAHNTDARTDFWSASVDLVKNYNPWGSGAGSFPSVYQIVEPKALLDPTYLNRAHNDWLEAAVTYGLPGTLFLTGAGLLYLKRAFQILRAKDHIRRAVIYARMAGVSIAILAVASISDYPVRTPIIMSVLMIFILWFWPVREISGNAKNFQNGKAF